MNVIISVRWIYNYTNVLSKRRYYYFCRACCTHVGCNIAKSRLVAATILEFRQALRRDSVSRMQILAVDKERKRKRERERGRELIYLWKHAEAHCHFVMNLMYII